MNEERFWAKVDKSGECWLWQGGVGVHGHAQYAVTRDGRRTTEMAYRRAWESLRGPIPAGLVLDHLCRMPACVNPEHLEPVTHAENILRGVGAPAANARKTHCIHGHAFSPENTTWRRSGARRCKVCAAEEQRRRRARRRAER